MEKNLSDHGIIPIAIGYNPQQRMALIFRQKCLCRDEHCGTLFLLQSLEASQACRRRGLWGGKMGEEIGSH